MTGKWGSLAEVISNARTLGAEVANVKVLEPALKEAGQPLYEDIVRTAPRRAPHPDMADDFVIMASKEERASGNAVVLIGPRNPRSAASNGHGFIAPFHEFGTSKMSARPWIRPAYDAFKGQFVAELRPILEAQFARVAKRFAKKGAAA